MITGDLDRALATEPSSAGTWRPAPPGVDVHGSGPGRYATSVAFRIARGQADGPERAAAALARRLDGLDWIAGTSVTGGGYLTVAVSHPALAALAVRITQAGPDCARSVALSGAAVTARRAADLPAARTWPQARARLTSHLTGRLAEASGATVTWVGGDGADGGASSPVADAIAYAGPDAIAFTLVRATPSAHHDTIDPPGAAARALGNPAYAVRYAHAHAASTLRQAADLGLDLGAAVGFQPWLLAHPSERALLYELSWLPERVAGAARRGQPGAFARYLEGLADAYLSCQESCPAAWPGMAPPESGSGRAADPAAEPGRTRPGGDGVAPAAQGKPGAPPAGPLIGARLWLAAAARTALAAGLGLLGVDAPDRL